MKNQPDITTLTIEELKKRAKTTQTVNGVLLGMLVIQFASGIYLTFKQGFNVFIVLPIAFLPLVILNYTNLKKIREEIAKKAY
jgi:hypothetical protein